MPDQNFGLEERFATQDLLKQLPSDLDSQLVSLLKEAQAQIIVAESYNPYSDEAKECLLQAVGYANERVYASATEAARESITKSGDSIHRLAIRIGKQATERVRNAKDVDLQIEGLLAMGRKALKEHNYRDAIKYFLKAREGPDRIELQSDGATAVITVLEKKINKVGNHGHQVPQDVVDGLRAAQDHYQKGEFKQALDLAESTSNALQDYLNKIVYNTEDALETGKARLDFPSEAPCGESHIKMSQGALEIYYGIFPGERPLNLSLKDTNK